VFRESSLELSVLLNLWIKLVCEVSCLVWLEQGSLLSCVIWARKSLVLCDLSKEVSYLVWFEQGSLFVLCDLEQGSLLLVYLSIRFVIFEIIVKSLGSARGLNYSRFVRGTSITSVCALSSPSLTVLFVFYILTSFFYPLLYNLLARKELFFKTQFNPPSCVFHLHISPKYRILLWFYKFMHMLGNWWISLVMLIIEMLE